MDVGDVAKLVLGLPGVEETELRGQLAWAVSGRKFAWERPYTKADLRRFGTEEPPEQPVVAVRTAGLAGKEGLLADTSPAVFTMTHFDGYPAVLVSLPEVEEAELREVILEGWQACASEDLLAEYEGRDGRTS